MGDELGHGIDPDKLRALCFPSPEGEVCAFNAWRESALRQIVLNCVAGRPHSERR